MRLLTGSAKIAVVGSTGLMLVLAARADEWPAYKHDARRSSVTEESLSFPLQPAWTYICAQPPAPAWPEPFRLLNRMDFDYAPALVVAEGLVYFGSSADDTVRALDAKTGREKWHFITGGPVRFAPAFVPTSRRVGTTAGKPQIEKGRVYFASDDGYVYCLNAQTGRGIWKINLAPADERFIGNHRMISRWPVRTGVLVDSGVVYAVAGMWPADGIFIYALAADTGKVLWCNDTVGGTPQGALLASRDVLLVPNGNARTTPLDRRTGALMQWPSPHGRPGWVAGSYANPKDYLGGRSGRGGTWVTLDGDTEYSFAMHRDGVLRIEPYYLTNGLAGRAWDAPQLTIEYSWGPNQIHEPGKVSAIVHQGKLYAHKAYGMALAGDTLLLGHEGAVVAQSATNAGEIWRAPVRGEARELAVTDGRLFVSTSEGVIYCFAPAGEKTEFRSQKSGGKSQEAKSGFADSNQSEIGNRKSEITLLLQQAGMDRGFALVLGDADGEMSKALAAQTQLQVINTLTDETQAAKLRENLLAKTKWYGSRIHVQHVERLDALPFAQYFANAVIVAAPAAGLSGAELYRVLRPCGGILLLPGMEKAAVEALILECDAYEAASHARSLQVATEPTPPSRLRPDSPRGLDYGGQAGHPSKEGISTNDPLQRLSRNKEWSLTNDPLQRRGGPDASRPQESRDDRDRGGFPFFVRGKLSGALDWDAPEFPKFKADRRVKWPLRPLWFGGPSTRQVQDFGESACTGPVVANGRYFMISEHALTAVDAYNGTVLWSRPIPQLNSGIRDVDGALYRVSDHTTARVHWRQARTLRVSDDNVYLALEPAYFQGKGEGLIQLDAHTGEQKKIVGPFNPPTPVVPLKSAQIWPLVADTNQSRETRDQSGMIAMESTARGLVLTLTTKDPSVTPLDVSPVGTGQRPSRDAWELYFDFRPVETRYGLYERGVFHLRVAPALDPAGIGAGAATPAAWRLITGPEAPKLIVSGTRDAAGTKTTVSLPWPELEKWVGVKPASFDFAATLNAHNGGRDEPIVRRHLFGNWTADGINNGWARIILDVAIPATGETNLPAVATPQALQAGPPAIVALGVKGGYNWGPTGYEAQKMDESVQEAPGIHPLTGEPVPKIYGIAPVCGGAYLSATIMSQAGGLYDLADNSGRRSPYYGVKTGCTTPQLAALGVFLISEEWGHCVCNQSFRTSLALAPAERRLNEDWAWFYDRDVDTRLRQAYVNLGAGGDRRDEKGNLWLGFPRSSELRTPEEFPDPSHGLAYPLGMRDAQTGLWSRRAIRGSVFVPLAVECAGPTNGQAASLGPYRFNTDRVRIEGTDRPWIYGCGYRGIRKATLKLDFFKPLVSSPVSTVDKPDGRNPAVAGRPFTAAVAAITVDGKLDEATWGHEFQQSTNGAGRATSAASSLPYTLTRVVFRHDSQNLYVGLQRPPMTYRPTRANWIGSGKSEFKSEPRPWRTTTNSLPDKIFWKDNQWRLIVSGDEGKRAAHFTVTPAGVRAEALYDPAMRDAWQAGGGTSATTNGLDWTWNPAWQSAVQTNEQGWKLEMAIPWTTLAEAGLNKDQLAVNFLMYDPGVGTEALTYLGIGGAEQCSNFTPLGLGKPVPIPIRAFTVRLHFAEPDDIRAGQRVFDVKLQGRTVLKDFDIVKEAKAPRTALVKEFKGVRAAEALTLEFVPAAQVVRPENAPILCGLELAESDAGSANRY